MEHKTAKSFYLIPIALVFLLVMSGCSKEEVGWPRWRGPNGDGVSTETDWDSEALAGGLQLLWKTDIGTGYANVAIKKNRLYTMGVKPDGTVVLCLDAETGEEIWQHSIEEFQDPRSTPTLDGKNVYALSLTGILWCLNAKNGNVRWKKDIVEELQVEKISFGYAGSPVIEGNLLILNVNTSGIALNKKTGDLIWNSKIHASEAERNYYATPVVYGDKGNRRVLFLTCIGITSAELESGDQLWSHSLKIREIEWAVDPVVFEDDVIVTTTSHSTLIETAENKPKVLWQNTNLRSDIQTSVLIDGYLYGFNGKADSAFGSLRCINWKTGDLMWQKKMKPAQLISASGKLIILEIDGILRIAEAVPSAYIEISSCDVLGGERKPRKFLSYPIPYNGRIYCRNFAGDLVCIDVSKKS